MEHREDALLCQHLLRTGEVAVAPAFDEGLVVDHWKSNEPASPGRALSIVLRGWLTWCLGMGSICRGDAGGKAAILA